MLCTRRQWTIEYVLLGYSLIMSNALLLFASSNDTADWSVWSTCSLSCGSGMQMRNRTCISGCNETLQTRECNTQRCYDLTLYLVLIILVTTAVISVMTAALFCIFLRRKQQRPKHRGSTTLEFSTCNKLRTYTTDNTMGGVRADSRLFYLQDLSRKDSRGSLVASQQTLS